MGIMLSLQEVTKIYPGVKHIKAIDSLSFDLEEGEICTVVGPSGCGKTTLGKTILGLVPAAGGVTLYDGRNISEFTPGELRRLRARIQMIFQDQVRTAYAPVDCFSAVLPVDNPGALGERGVLIRSDWLKVNEAPLPGSDSGSMELMAGGNATAEGDTFFSRAARMSYAQAKDLLILEGDGRTLAEVFHQPQVGGQTSKHAARKILYWPGTGRLEIEDARSFEFNEAPGR